MQTTESLYTYEIITKDQPDLIEKAAACLAKTFTGVEVAARIDEIKEFCNTILN